MRRHRAVRCLLARLLAPARRRRAAPAPAGAGARGCRAADAGTRRRPRHQRRADEQPRCLRSLFEPTWRQFQIGGRFTSVDGDPARFQRYQDLRDGVLFTDAAVRARGSGRATGCSARRPTTSAGAISDTSPTTSAPAASWSPACGTRFRSSTASTRRRRTRRRRARWCSTTRRSERSRTGRRRCRRTCRSRRSSISRERRDIGNVELRGDADAERST